MNRTIATKDYSAKDLFLSMSKPEKMERQFAKVLARCVSER